eukprot:g4848.t1
MVILFFLFWSGLAVLLLSIARAFYVHLTHPIPGPFRWPLVGNLLWILHQLGSTKSFENVIKIIHAQYGPVCRLSFGNNMGDFIFIADAKLAKETLKSTQRAVCIGTNAKNELKPEYGFPSHPMFNLSGSEWTHRRKFLVTMFAPAHVTKVLPHSIASVARMLARWEQETGPDGKTKPFDVHNEINYALLNAIGHTICGVELASNTGPLDTEHTTEHPLSSALSYLIDCQFKELFMPFLQYLRDRLKMQQALETINKTTWPLVTEYMDMEEDELAAKRNLLAQLVLKAKDPASSMTVTDVHSEVIQFIIAGFDTSSNTLSWYLYHLCQRPEQQERIAAEVLAAFPDIAKMSSSSLPDLGSLLSLSSLSDERLPLLAASLLELSRLQPIFPFLDRVLEADVNASGYSLPKGARVCQSLWAIHHDSKVWGEDHAEFRAERCLPLITKQGNPELLVKQRNHLIPFGGGGKQCLGMQLAKAQLKAVAVLLLARFHFTLAPDHPRVFPKQYSVP